MHFRKFGANRNQKFNPYEKKHLSQKSQYCIDVLAFGPALPVLEFARVNSIPAISQIAKPKAPTPARIYVNTTPRALLYTRDDSHIFDLSSELDGA